MRLLVSEKADLCVMTFQTVQSAVGSDCELCLCRGRQLFAQEQQNLHTNEDNSDPINVFFHSGSKCAFYFVPGRIDSC